MKITMKLIYPISYIVFISMLLFVACHQTGKQKVNNTIINNTTNSAEVENIVQVNPIDTIISTPFLQLIRHIDSLGYTFDSLYNQPRFEKIHVYSYMLYKQPVETTMLFEVVGTHEENGLDEKLLKDFDLKPLKKVNKIMTYYFKQKEPEIINGSKWYTDGLIEEWSFTNVFDAEAAYKQLISAELCYIYFNTCALICVTNHKMYIFHSRASKFMYTQKKFFNWFIKQNNITLYVDEHY